MKRTYSLSTSTMTGTAMHRSTYLAAIWLTILLTCLCSTAVQAQTVTVQYIHTDALGSPVAVTNEAGQVIERTLWEPYGAAIGKPNYDGPGYTGHVMDGATGLTYMQQRYYDKDIGRFLSVDPVTAYRNGDSRYFNRYWYAAGNPYTFTDPDGRWFGVASKVVKVIAKGGNVAATVAGAVEDSKTLVSREATLGQRAMAGASLLTEVFSPVSARDVKAGVNAIQAVDNAGDGARGADFIVTSGGTAVHSSQTAMERSLRSAGIEGTPISGGMSYQLPNGVTARAMDPSGQAPRRTSFDNAGGAPVTPEGNVPQPPRGLSRSERVDYVRERTHVEQHE